MKETVMKRTDQKPIEKSLRDQILSLIKTQSNSQDKIIKALADCRNYYIDQAILEKISKESGYRFSNFQTNQNLELFFDISKGRYDIGYISKGWNDPGFRIGNILVIPNVRMQLLQSCIMQIMNICAVRGFSTTIINRKDYVELHIDSVVYSDGFNQKVFVQVVENLNECVEKTYELLG
jgi:hypothetical protein